MSVNRVTGGRPPHAKMWPVVPAIVQPPASRNFLLRGLTSPDGTVSRPWGVFLYSLSTLWVWVEGVIKTSGLFPWCCFAGMGISQLGFPNRLCW